MKNKMHLPFILVIMFSVVLSSCSGSAKAASTSLVPAPILSADIASVIAKYQGIIPQGMQENSIAGVAIAVVDDQKILWEQSFGYTDVSHEKPINPDTIFSIQSITKSFTATAVMFAAQDGLVDLDAPITTYLPDFHVNSIFEEHPEQKITLRILLSHTAGFPLEAPYGNNYDHPAYSFEKHIASISDTWLRFPVGSRYNYSNLDIDLAGYILQIRSGMPYIQYVQEKVLRPLGMMESTLDVVQVRAISNRAIGAGGSSIQLPLDFLFIPSGGMWTSAADMTRYLQFHLNKGTIDGKRLLREDLAETMYTPPNAAARNLNYALGINVDTRNNARHIQHGGGGWGFSNSLVWYPELRLGAVVLTNVQDNGWCVQLSEKVLDSIIQSNSELYSRRAAARKVNSPAYLPSQDDVILSDGGLQALISSKALPVDSEALQRRSSYAGTYIWTGLEVPTVTVQVMDHQGQLSIQYPDESGPLTEVEPGLFFAPGGDTFDVRGTTPRVRNVALVKANPRVLPFEIAFYTLCGLVFLSTLIFWPLSSLIRHLRRKNGRDQDSDSSISNYRLIWTGILAALASLSSLISLGLVVLIPSLVYLPWPHPYQDMSWWQYAIFSFPFVGLSLGAVMVLMVVLALRSHTWGQQVRVYYCLAALALIFFNLALII